MSQHKTPHLAIRDDPIDLLLLVKRNSGQFGGPDT